MGCYKPDFDMKTIKFSNTEASARCEECEFEVHSRNAHGLAAQHHYKTGHTVTIDKHSSHTMTAAGSNWHHDWKRIKGL